MFLSAFTSRSYATASDLPYSARMKKEFNTDYGLHGGLMSNLDFALSLNDPYKIFKEILRGHPFKDGNKRTSLMIYLMSTTNKNYDEILTDFYIIFTALSK